MTCKIRQPADGPNPTAPAGAAGLWWRCEKVAGSCNFGRMKMMKDKEVKFKLEQKDQLKKMGVIGVYLFGSQVEKIAGALSDLDVGVVFDHPETRSDRSLKMYNDLYRLFSEVFANESVPLDVVFLQFTPPSLQYRAVRDGKVIYNPDHNRRFYYEAEVLGRHADLQHFYRLSHNALMARI